MSLKKYFMWLGFLAEVSLFFLGGMGFAYGQTIFAAVCVWLGMALGIWIGFIIQKLAIEKYKKSIANEETN